MRDTHLSIPGLGAGVRLLDCGQLEACLPAVLAGMPYKVAPTGGEASFATVIHANGRFRVHAPAVGAPTYQKDPVNAVCELVGIIARYMGQQADRLVLHAAAVALNGALIVFPAGRRAGKSLLTVALAQQGVTIFGDDVLPVALAPSAPVRGVALGVSPRLRLPLPKHMANVVDVAEGTPAVENDQYRYLAVSQLAPAGQQLPIGAFVALRLADSGPPRLERFSRGVMLSILLKQNFGRRGRAELLLAGLYQLAGSAPSYELVYRDPTEAASLLRSELAPRLKPVAPILEAPPATPPPMMSQAGGVDEDLLYQRREGAMIRELEGECFAASPDGGKIHRLNEGLFRIWKLLDEPATPAEIANLLRSAYGDISEQQIANDVLAAFAGLVEAGLIAPSEGQGVNRNVV